MKEQLVMAIFNGLILTTIFVSQFLLVRRSKDGMVLGVKVHEDIIKSNDMEDLIKGYERENLIIGIISLILISVATFYIENIRLFIISIFLYMEVLLLIYLRWNKKVRVLTENKKWDKIKKRKGSKENELILDKAESNSVSQRWFLVPAGIIFVNIIVGLAIYPILADKLPIYWDAQGNVDSYMAKSVMGVLLIPIMQLFLGVVTYFVYLSVKKAKYHENPRDPKRSIRKNLIYRKVWSGYFIIVLTLVEFLLTVLNMMTLGLITNINLFNLFSFVITGLIVVGALVLAIIMGQGGDRLKLEDDPKLRKKNMDDEFWRLGSLIYFNPENPEVFIENRVGIGWTVNIGKPTGIILVAFPIIILIIALIVVG